MINIEHIVEGLFGALLGILTYLFKTTKTDMNNRIDKVEKDFCDKITKIEIEQSHMNPVVRKIDSRLARIETDLAWIKAKSK